MSLRNPSLASLSLALTALLAAGFLLVFFAAARPLLLASSEMTAISDGSAVGFGACAAMGVKW